MPPSHEQTFEANPRAQIINTYLATIDSSFRDNRPRLKLINFGTGSGKTHQFFRSICQTISAHPDEQIVGVYVAPLREHLHVPTSIIEDFPQIPFYTLYSQEQRVQSEFLQTYQKLIPLICKNRGPMWKRLLELAGREPLDAALAALRSVLKVITKFVYLSGGEFDKDDKFINKQLLDCQRDINGSLEDFLEFLIKAIPDETEWMPECLALVEIFFPLYLLRERSGVLLLTYEKFETAIPYFAFNGKAWVKRRALLDSYISEHSDDRRKFICAFDEQEDGYQIMLSHQIDIVSPRDLAINNALASISRELSVLFSPLFAENGKLLRFLRKNPGAILAFEESHEKGKSLDRGLLEYKDTYDRLVYEEGDAPEFLLQLAKVSDELEECMQSIAAILGRFGEGETIRLDFEMLFRVLEKFLNNRTLLIPQRVYTKYAEDLMNIFSYNNLYVYNIEPLKHLFLERKPDGHVHITETASPRTASVAELIYAIFTIRLQIDAIRRILANVLDAEDTQSRSLGIWSSQTGRRKDSDLVEPPTGVLRFMNREYVYRGLKTVVNIMEITRYQHPKNNLINSRMREISIGNTAITASPEHRLLSILIGNSNVIFLISATGGMAGDLTTSFDLRYLEDSLRDDTGQTAYRPMVGVELELSEHIRRYRQMSRQITVDFFNTDLASFPNRLTLEAVKQFEEGVLNIFVRSHGEGRDLGIHKVAELRNFVRFLFYLLEDDSLKDTIAFTQTIRWIQELVAFAQRSNYASFRFTRSSDNPNIYYFELAHKSYQGKVRIKLIFYESQFNQRYLKTSRKKTYQEELVDEDGQKIFFISAYQSAAKGLNPTIQAGSESRDFNSLVLLMDRYYSIVGPTLGKHTDGERTEATKAEVQFHFALMKYAIRFGDTNIEIRNFNQYLNSPEAEEFRALQHRILMGKGILQALGRTERRDFKGQVVRIFINEETRANLVAFYRYLETEQPDEIRKLSVNNHAVYERVQEEARKLAIQDYEHHVAVEMDATEAIRRFRKKMLEEVDLLHRGRETMKIVQAWEMLRDPIVLRDPAKYLDMLRASGLFPEDFVNALFYRNTSNPAYVPYLATEETEDGRPITIISDSVHANRIYPYRNMLFPEYMKLSAGSFDLEGEEVSIMSPSTAHIQRLYRKLLPQPDAFNTFIPRPSFFYDVLYPSLSEAFTHRWIQQWLFRGTTWPTIKAEYNGFQPLDDFDKYKGLFELYDLFYVRGATLFCIDVKAWGSASGNRLSQPTVQKALAKLNTIAQNYPEFKRVRGLLLNLHASQDKRQRHAANLYSGNLIYVDENYFPVESDVLQDFLFDVEE